LPSDSVVEAVSEYLLGNIYANEQGGGEPEDEPPWGYAQVQRAR